MMPNRHDAAALAELIDRLGSATGGDPTLDLRIEYIAGVALENRVDAAELLIEDGFSWETVSEALEDRVPPYTVSLDAALPGENIVLVVKSARRAKWGAAHRDASGREFLAWARTEPMARRSALLMARHAELLEDGASSAPLQGNNSSSPEEMRDWKVMF